MQAHVFEKSSSALRDRGAGLGIPTAVALALRDQGLIYDGFPHVSLRSLAHTSASQTDTDFGKRAGDIPTFLEGIRWGHLYEQLRSLVPNNRYHSGVALVSARNEDEGVKVTFDNGLTEVYDLLVFADGARSIGREIVCPAHQPQYSGYFLWRGTLPESRLRQDTDRQNPFDETLQRVGYAMGHFFSYLLPNENGTSDAGQRELNWGMFLPLNANDLSRYLLDSDGVKRTQSVPPGMMRPELEQHLKADAKRLLPGYFAQLVVDSQGTFGQGIFTTMPSTYHQGRICLVGDAGALVPPFTTSGVFKGIKNAGDLMSAIADAPNLDGALRAWEQQQIQVGESLHHLSGIMSTRLLTQVPNFADLTQETLTHWWSDIQIALEAIDMTPQ